MRSGALRVPALLALTLVVGLFLVGSASAASTLDQQQPLINTTLGPGAGLSVSQQPQQTVAQVVTSGIAGLLTEIRLPIECIDTASLTLEINDAEGTPGANTPGPNNLARSTLPGTLFPIPNRPPAFRSVPLAAPPFIPARTTFAFILSASGSGCVLIPGPNLDLSAYPRGDGFYNNAFYPPGSWQPLFGDLAFQTFVDPVCRVPIVVGALRRSAEALISQYGCAVGSVATRFASKPSGTVLSTAPKAGTQLASGAAVNLVLSRGPRPCIVPNVVGKTLRSAASAIAHANCRLGRIRHASSPRVKPGRVIAQSPRPGRRLRPRAPVSVVISRGSR
jgi:PASTA domain